MTLVHEQMVKVTAALDYIPKQRSQGVNYEFRSIDALMNHLHGPLADAGLFLSPRVLDDWRVDLIPGSKDRQQVQAVFRVCVDVYASDGSCVTLGPGLAQSHDYGDKAVYQAQQNAIKYILLEAFCIPTAEQDMDAREPAAVPGRASADQVATIGDLLSRLDADQSDLVKAQIKSRFGVSSAKELTVQQADEVLQSLTGEATPAGSPRPQEQATAKDAA